MNIFMNFDMLNLALNILIGFFIGFMIGMTGIGGGVLVMPSLIHILKIPAVPAVGTGLAFALFTKIGGLVQHIRLKTVRKRTGFYFMVGSIPSVIISSYILNYLSKKVDPGYLNSVVQVTIGVVLLITCVIMIIETYFIKKTNGYYIPQDKFPLNRKIGGICAGAIIGLLLGATSIGGGVLVIPVLVILFNLRARDVVGTSIMISVMLTVVGSLIYLLCGNLIISTVILMTLGSLPGVFLGSKIAVRLPDKILKSIVIVIITVAGISLFFGSTR